MALGRLLRRMAALAAFAAASAAAQFTGTMSGSWWDPARGGEGQFLTFETLGSRNVATIAYFTYTGAGAATWLVGNADYPAGATSITIPVVTGSGARFGNDFRAGDVQINAAGTVTLEYISCSQIRLRYTGSQTYTLTIQRLVGELHGSPCVVASQPTALDLQLRALLPAFGQTGTPAAGRNLPSIDSPLAQLGKLLFFSKALSGDLDTACASCHHPALGGADALSLSVGAGAAQPNVVGIGRRRADNAFSVGRNSNTFFNVGLLDKGLFWDSRVESLGKIARTNGGGSGIRTPDTALDVPDPNAGANLPAAQARFPVVSVTEMKGGNTLADGAYRAHLAARLGNYGTGAGQLGTAGWVERFRAVFGNGTAEQVVTFDNVAAAIAAYQRSATFVESPWARYARGDNGAIPESAKRGALLFFRTPLQGGAGCSACHTGDALTNERHHALGFPQIGPGKGDGNPANDDFGRGRETGQPLDRYRYRTPPLLNVELTAPYGHAGQYPDLDTVVAHYVVPDQTVASYLATRTWCISLPQFAALPDCAASSADVTRNTNAAMAQMRALRTAAPTDALPVLNPDAVTQADASDIVAFLRALTDPCLRDRACFGRWIPSPSEAPDGHQLNAVDANGRTL